MHGNFPPAMLHVNWGHEAVTARTDRGLSARSGLSRRRCLMGSFVRRRFHPLRVPRWRDPRSEARGSWEAFTSPALVPTGP